MEYDYGVVPVRADVFDRLVVADYLAFGLVFAMSIFIGLYFGIVKGSFHSGARELLTANGQLSILPVCFSMLSCFVTSILYLGQTTEAFLFGPQLWLLAPSSILVAPIVGALFVPFFQEKKHTSVYQFFEDRFDKYVQIIASVMYTIHMIFYMAVMLYIPSIVVHQVTGLDTFTVVSVMYLFCTFYATIGGIKALVWLNTFQVVILFSALSIVLIIGTISLGGFSAVWAANKNNNLQSDRGNIFNWSLDPTLRYSVLSSFFGSAFTNMSLSGGNQMQIQRFLTLKTPARARIMLQLSILFRILFLALTVYAGLLMFAFYSTCDPVKSEKVATMDELFPLYVMHTVRSYPGLFGLFLAGFFGAGLGFVSNGINSLAALWVDELRGTFLDDGDWDKQSGIWLRCIALFFAVISYSMVFLIPHSGKLVAVIILLANIISGSLFGVVCLGMFVPSSNSISAAIGLVSSVSILTWMSVGNSFYSRSAIDFYSQLNLTTTGCQNTTITSSSFVNSRLSNNNTFGFYLYEISYLWYAFLAIVFTVTIGYLVSVVVKSRFVPDAVAIGGEVKRGKNELKKLKLIDFADKQTTEPFLNRKISVECKN